MKGFDEEYWKLNYSEPEEMDGIVNADRHARYLSSFFSVDYVDISSVIDWGFGLGHLLNHLCRELKPHTVMGIEPSPYAFKQGKKKIRVVKGTDFELQEKDLKTWCKDNDSKSEIFDLGICTSVFQYLTEKEIVEVLPVMAKTAKYLYFSVPTNIELNRQVTELGFKDTYAKKRSAKWYLEKLAPHFTIISSRILESKVYFNQKSTSFTDLLYRF